MKRLFVLFFVLIGILNANSQTVLDKMSENINQTVQTDYSNGEKWIAFVHASAIMGGTIMVDMADYLEITPEGQQGWVTIWANATLGIGLGEEGLPFSFGLFKRKYSLNTPDSPNHFLEVSGDISAAGFTFIDMGVQVGADKLAYIDYLTYAPEVSFDVAGVGLSFHVFSIEVKKDRLNDLLNSLLVERS